MFSIALDDIAVFTIGPVQDMRDAEWRAEALVTEVLADAPVKPPAAPKTKKVTTVEKGDSTTTTTVEEVPVLDPKAEEKGSGEEAGTGASGAGTTTPTATAGPASDPPCWRRDISEDRDPR
jgi:hypothetical protein